MATFYLAIYPAGAATPTWDRANVGTNSGWSGSPVYHDADTDPGTGSTYQFVPDASGLSAGTAYDAYAVWDDGTNTSWIVSQLGWSTASAFAAPANLSGTPSANSITWSWSAVPTATGYEIERGPVGGPYTTVDVGNSLSHEHTGLTGSTQYEARVRAYK